MKVGTVVLEKRYHDAVEHWRRHNFKDYPSLLENWQKYFPTDDEFRRDLQTRDLYNFRSRSYWLRRLENHGRRERVAVDPAPLHPLRRLVLLPRRLQAYRSKVRHRWRLECRLSTARSRHSQTGTRMMSRLPQRGPRKRRPVSTRPS